MKVAIGRAISTEHNEPRKALLPHQAGNPLRSHICCDSDDLLNGNHDIGGLFVRELQSSLEQPAFVGQQTFAFGFGDDRLDFFDCVGGIDIIARSDPTQLQQRIGESVERMDDKAEDLRQHHQRRCQKQHRMLCFRQGNVLRNHFADDHVQERHNRKRNREADRTRGGRRNLHPLERTRQQVMNSRLSNVAEHEGADRNAQLADRQHKRHVLHRVQRGLSRATPLISQGLDLRSTRRHNAEFSSHKEGIAQNENDKPQKSQPVVHSAVLE